MSARPLATAFSLVWASPETTVKSESFRPVVCRKSGQICDMESPGVMATILPLMSSGLRMFWSLNAITDIGERCSATPTVSIGAPFIAARIMVGTSA